MDFAKSKLLVLALLLPASCNHITTDDCACTAEFRAYSVSIVDIHYQPVDSLITWVTDKKSSVVYRRDSSHVLGLSTDPGRYVVLTDAELSYSGNIDTVIFHAVGRHDTLSQLFGFYTDACFCHVYKSWGPDSIFVN